MTVAVDIPPKEGEIVRVRSRRYLVEAVDAASRPEDQTLVRLSCLEDDAEGEELEVLWEKEVDAQRISTADWTKLAQGNFDDPRHFGAYYHTLRWNSVTSTDPQLFQAPYRAGIRIDAYQLEPLRKALLLPRVNLFIADDVGLGKTIEAGLIVRELLMRQRVRRIVVAAPPSVLLQWKEELDQRFGLTFVVFDREYVRRMRQERGFAVNPWATHSRFIVTGGSSFTVRVMPARVRCGSRNEEQAGTWRTSSFAASVKSLVSCLWPPSWMMRRSDFAKGNDRGWDLTLLNAAVAATSQANEIDCLLEPHRMRTLLRRCL